MLLSSFRTGRCAARAGASYFWLFWCVALVVFCLRPSQVQAIGLPPGFSTAPIAGPVDNEWDDANGILFDAQGRMYVWERAGRIWVRETATTPWLLLLDITEEVGYWRDFGLMSVALDPEFQTNGHLYLLYVVDRHHLLHFGTPSYNPAADEPQNATIGRITRYTARASDGFKSVDPASRRILIGSLPSNGFPITQNSHGVGTLLFGTDGTLLASCGDGAHISMRDRGSATGSFYAQALIDGILTPEENVGAFRTQMIDSLNGKIVRIDPATGAGEASNPFYDATRPTATRSKIWALGFRNPFRMSLRPDTGSSNRADGAPGVLVIGDVGDLFWEEMNFCTQGGQNFGWPIFQGGELNPGYSTDNVRNRLAVNPLGDGGSCAPLFLFRDLIHQASLIPGDQPPFANPCSPALKIPSSIPQFLHTPPTLEWDRDSDSVRTWRYNDVGVTAPLGLKDPSSGIAGETFRGNCSVGGVWYTGSKFPSSYHRSYFHLDFGGRWIRNFTFDEFGAPTSVRPFLTEGELAVALAVHPVDGDLYYAAFTEQQTSVVRRITYTPTGNLPPVAVATADRTYGNAPLTVRFTGGVSRDPEGQPLTYDWNFGDGTPHSIVADPTHTYEAPAGVLRSHTVVLTVTDQAGHSAQASLRVSLNNTPPAVQITSPGPGTLYPMDRDSTHQLRATVVDRESDDAALRYNWQTFLHHNEHNHPEPIDHNHQTSTLLSPIGCDGNTYYYRIVLTVTDPGGLSGRDEVIVAPDCGSEPQEPSFVILTEEFSDASGGKAYDAVLDAVGGAAPYTWTLVAGSLPTGLTINSLSGHIVGTPTDIGTFNFTIEACDSGTPALTVRKPLALKVSAPPPPGEPGRLVNLSIRGTTAAGERTLIAGFHVGTGSGSLPVLLRGVGPSLATHQVEHFLPDPELRLFGGSQLEAANDNWAGDPALAEAGARTHAFPYVSSTSCDAAILRLLPPGGYTLHVAPRESEASGVVLAECYNASALPAAGTGQLTNVSGRGYVASGEGVVIAGFVVAGSTPVRLLVRAIGPTLVTHDVSDVLPDPVLDLYAGGTLRESNDNWGGTAALAQAFASVNAFALNPAAKDAALIVTLPAGSYTAHVRSATTAAGVALVEVYHLP